MIRGPCRYCRRDAYLLDDEGRPAHPCCTRWMGEHEYAYCLACEASDRAARERAERVESLNRRPRSRRIVNTPPL